MKKVTFLAFTVLVVSLTSCRGYEREQDRLDRESEGKGELLKAESTKKVKIEQAKADYESAKLDAMTKLTKVEAEAKAKLIAAKASAEAKLINARAEAEANKTLNASITPEILEYFKIERWNGKLPTVTGNSSTLIDLK
jgi:regulator of protease activity HflC (stomatin/prohibitin superfamily)